MKNDIVNRILQSSPDEAWATILHEIWKEFKDPIQVETSIMERDKNIGALDTLLSGSAWELWQHIAYSDKKTTTQLIKFWDNSLNGKAVLVLDALSLREASWLMEQAEKRGYQIVESKATLAEIPGDTTPFAKALGFSQRSSLSNNGGTSIKFPRAFTESVDLPFKDCRSLIPPEPNIMFWHHWPDSAMHTYADDGNGSYKLSKVSKDILTSDDFWEFINKLSTGRSLVITGDHGYANSGLFRDLVEKEQIEYMKKLFKSGRSTTLASGMNHYWSPPLTLTIDDSILVLGRRKWKSPGGYPTLTHGGLSLLEMAVPYIQINRK
jgi:hypothetical protein